MGMSYLDPRVVSALERFIAHGGTVLTTTDTTVKIAGAVDLGMTPQLPDQAIIDKFSYESAARSNGQSWDAADQKGIDALKKASVKIVQANPAFVAEVHKRSQPIIEDWIKKASVKLPNARQVLAEFHADLKKVAAGK
jgi:hypothetical protein